MNLSPELWSEGLEYAAYRAQVSRNQETFDEVYDSPAFTAGDLAFLRQLPQLKILCLGEDWCADVYQTLPTWARVVEELSGWSFRVFPRDQHLELMERFLWRGYAQRIPVYAFYDQRNVLQLWWSGRSRAAQAELDGYLDGRKFADLNEGEKNGARRVLNDGYRREFRRANFEEILMLLGSFFHVGR